MYFLTNMPLGQRRNECNLPTDLLLYIPGIKPLICVQSVGGLFCSTNAKGFFIHTVCKHGMDGCSWGQDE